MLSADELKAVEQIQGEVRGVTLQTDAEFVRRKYGAAGLARVKAALEKAGQPIAYEDIKAMQWYPLRLRVLSLLAIRRVLNLSDEDIKAMGSTAPKYFFVVKLMMKFFISPSIAFHRAPDYWSKHYSIGTVEARELNEAKSYALLDLKDFRTHPICCTYLAGYFLSLFEYLLPGKGVRIEETECIFRNGDKHLFKATWSAND